MKRFLSIICVGLMLMQLLPVSVLAEGGATRVLKLPAGLKCIDINSFMDDASIASVVIPAGVTEVRTGAFENCQGLESIVVEGGSQAVIWENAFQDCANLKQFVVGSDCDIVLEDHVFAGCAGAFDFYVSQGARVYFNEYALENCGEITFHVHHGTEAELYALAHGYTTELLDAPSAIDQSRAMIAAYGVAPSVLLSDDPFETMRLIVRTSEDHLPDISGYAPVSIVKKDANTYLVQFTSSINAEECCQYLQELDERAEPDRLLASHLPFSAGEEEISAAGVTVESVWGTDDPMGFNYYADYVASVSGDSDSVVIAVIDSGVVRGNDYDDILLKDKGANFASDGDFDDWDQVYNYHGSEVASVIKTCVNHANVRIMPIRVEEATGLIDTWSLVDAIEHAMENGANIINLSEHLEMPSEYVDDVLERAMNAGLRIVASAGNDNNAVTDVYPANYPGVVAVAGIGPDYKLSRMTASGVGVSYAAPCEWITHTLPGSPSGGTSYAAPQIASALALIELDPNHEEADMDAVCLPIESKDGSVSGAGKGMPQLNELANIPTTAVRFDDNTPTIMTVDSEHALKWSVTPKKATDRTVTVTSDNADVVEVDVTNGVTLRALSTGSARITLRANDGASPAVQHEITVVRPVDEIQLAMPTYQSWYNSASHGDPFEVEATVLPADATNEGIAWYSTNTGVATVSQEGVVTPRGVGVSVIVASAEDGYGAFGYARVAVTEYPDAEGMVLTDGESTTEALTYMGATVQLSGTIFPTTAQQDIDWSVAPGTGVATVSDTGLVTPTAPGSVTVRGTARSDETITADFEVYIVDAPSAATVHAASTALYPNGKTAMDISIEPVGAYVPRITWHSADPSVATIDPVTGEVTAVKRGSTSIYATVDTTVTERTTLLGTSEAVSIPGGTTFNSNYVQIEVKASPTVYFNYNGGNELEKTRKVYEGQAIGALPQPTRNGFAFDRWTTESGNLVTESTVCGDQDMRLVAQWTPLTFQVVFDPNPQPGMTGSPAIIGSSTITATVNQAIGPMPSARCDYWTFQGWYTVSAPTGGTRVYESQTYPTASKVVLYARWTLNDFQGWGDWTEQYLEETTYRHRDSMSIPIYEVVTVYHYDRYIWKRKYWTSFDQHQHSGTPEYQTTESLTPFPLSGNGPWLENGVPVYEYKGDTRDGCYYWYHEWTSTKQGNIIGNKTMYRYSYRKQ